MNFGAFVRDCRKALGLKQADIAARCGLDISLISKMENGKRQPPQDRAVLRAYATALELEENSAHGAENAKFLRFMSLAAIAAGRIPDGVSEEQILRQAQPRFHGLPWEIRAIDLAHWADRIEASFTLPKLINRLIGETTPHLLRCTMPSDEGTRLPGFDGRVETAKGNKFVPAGLSSWELSVNNEPTSKFKGEIGKRQKAISEHERQQTSFVVVTPRIWSTKEKWCEEQQKQGTWKEVRAYDAHDLVQWLDIAPATALWFAEHLGKPTKGLKSIESHWDHLCALAKPDMTEPEILAQLLLTSRLGEGGPAEQIRTWLYSRADQFTLCARSTEEALDVLAAVAMTISSGEEEHIYGETLRLLERRDESEFLRVRILIVENRELLPALSQSGQAPLILILPSGETLRPEDKGKLQAVGHRLLLVSSHYNSHSDLVLERPRSYEMQAALTLWLRSVKTLAGQPVFDGGRAENLARRLAKKATQSPLSLKDYLLAIPRDPEVWLRDGEDPVLKITARTLTGAEQRLLPALLLGAFDREYTGDKDAALALSGCPSYVELERLLGQVRLVEEALVERIGTVWHTLNPERLWRAYGAHISQTDLEAFEQQAETILTYDHPKYGLPKEKRFAAAITLDKPKYSERLQRSVAETLAIMGTYPLTIGDLPSKTIADRIVLKILEKPRWQRWASLQFALPLLAEAAPEALLACVEGDLNRQSSAGLVALLKEEDPDGFGGSPHIGALWALETLAWSDQLEIVSGACLALARWAEWDEGGLIDNRPFRSLSGIFDIYAPEIYLSLGQQQKILLNLMRKEPVIATKLFVHLLPDEGRVLFPHAKASYRAWGLSTRDRASRDDVQSQQAWICQQLATSPPKEGHLWRVLLERMWILAAQDQSALLDACERTVIPNLDTAGKREFSDLMRKTAAHHRNYPQAFWVFSEPVITRIEQLQHAAEPEDVVHKWLWLFEAYPAKYLEATEERSWEEEQSEINERRVAALQNIESACGVDGLRRLIELSQTADEIGKLCADAAPTLVGCADVLPHWLDDKSDNIKSFAQGFLGASYAAKGENWFTLLGTETWNSAQQLAALCSLPFQETTWDRLEHCGSEIFAEYWKTVQRRGREIPRSADNCVFALEQLITHGRPNTAIDLLCSVRLQTKAELVSNSAMANILARVLAVESVAERDCGPQRIAPSLVRLLKVLQEDKTLDNIRLARLELGYLPFLVAHKVRPTALFSQFRQDPQVYVEVLKQVYRAPAQDAAEQREWLQSAVRMAKYVLDAFNDFPGMQADGSVDEDILGDWISEIRRLSEQADILRKADHHIGALLASAPKDERGLHDEAVRQIIEDLESDVIERGFSAAIFNSRGAYGKMVGEGGKQERVFALHFGKMADLCGAETPRVAKIYRDLASTYEDWAERADQDVLKEW